MRFVFPGEVNQLAPQFWEFILATPDMEKEVAPFSVNIAAFNLGNALGAVVGGWVIAPGWGLLAVPIAGGILAAPALIQPGSVRDNMLSL
jgi:predicted MFS family arabinose efflux permease